MAHWKSPSWDPETSKKVLGSQTHWSAGGTPVCPLSMSLTLGACRVWSAVVLKKRIKRRRNAQLLELL